MFGWGGVCTNNLELQILIFKKILGKLGYPSVFGMSACSDTGSPSSKYEHRRTSALLRNILNIRICFRKKPSIVSVT